MKTPTHTDPRSVMLAHAIEVIDAEGEQALRVRDVAAAAGLTYTAIAHHFGSREGLIEAAYVEAYRRGFVFGAEQTISAFDAATTVEEFRSAIDSSVRAVLIDERAWARRQRAIALGAAATRPRLAAQLRAFEDDFLVVFERMLRNPIRRGWISPDADLRAMATLYIAIVNSRYLIEMAPGGAADDAWTRYAVHAVQSLIEPN